MDGSIFKVITICRIPPDIALS